MHYNVFTEAGRRIPAPDLDSMHQLRHQVFHDKLGWEVNSKNGREFDEFDELTAVTYVLAKAPDGRVDACWRLLPTTGPYMLKDTFPQLLHGLPAPQADDCWELSRFAVATDRADTATAAFGPISMALMTASADFALEHGIQRYVTVTTPPMERMLRQQGLHVHRIGPSMKIGVSAAVALVIEIDNKTLAAVNRPNLR